MVVIGVALMFLLLIGLSYFVEKRHKQKVESTAQTLEINSQLYIHPSHTFARILNADMIEIGMDEFAQRAFGKVEFAALPSVGNTLKQGDRLWKLKVGDRYVSQRMPMSGKIVETCQGEFGWILKARVTDISNDIANLIKGASVVPWLKKARAQFVTNYSGELMPALQDGGELVEGFARHLTDEQWKEFGREFFNCESCEN